MKSLKESILGKQKQDLDKVTNNVQETKHIVGALKRFLQDLTIEGEPDSYREEKQNASHVNDPVVLRYYFTKELKGIVSKDISKSNIDKSVKDKINLLKSYLTEYPIIPMNKPKLINQYPLTIKAYTLNIQCSSSVIIEFRTFVDRHLDDYVLNEFDIIINKGLFQAIYPDKKL